ncbi:hypothetical protein [Novosphingopyxis sp.]|uniref:hypothetical protein n=1 Tax=Novosphingopyxis sp. TaxID=2709690 RepID=UPI003B5BDA6E
MTSLKKRIVWLLGKKRKFGSSLIDLHIKKIDEGDWACTIDQARGAYAGFWTALGCTLLSDRQFFFPEPDSDAKDFIIAVRLDAGDENELLKSPWPNGNMVANDVTSFEVSDHGDPVDCNATMHWGFGKRGLNNLSPCGRLVSTLWLKDADKRRGSIETRVYQLGGEG